MLRWTVLILLLALLLPSAAAAPAVFYGHLDDHAAQDFPLSADEPPVTRSVDAGLGLLTHSLGCVPETPGNGLVGVWHEYGGFVVPGPVEYQEGRPTYGDRGLPYDVKLEADQEPVFHWYVSAGDEAGLGVPMEVEAHVSLHGGDGLVAPPYDGPVIASGSSEPILMVPGAPEHSVVAGRDVYHFQVPLRLERHELPATGVALRVELRLALPVCDEEGQNLLLDQLRIHSSPDHRPRLELSVLEPVRVDYVHAQFVNGSFVLRAAVRAALGPVALQTPTLSLVGPDGPIDTPNPTRTEPLHCHCYPPPPDTFTWVIPHGDWPSGPYAYQITFDSPAGPASFEGAFVKAADAQAPGAPLALAAGALLVAALAGRVAGAARRGRTDS